MSIRSSLLAPSGILTSCVAFCLSASAQGLSFNGGLPVQDSMPATNFGGYTGNPYGDTQRTVPHGGRPRTPTSRLYPPAGPNPILAGPTVRARIPFFNGRRPAAGRTILDRLRQQRGALGGQGASGMRRPLVGDAPGGPFRRSRGPRPSLFGRR